MANLKKEEIIEAIENLSVLELSELVKSLEEKFGIKATGFMPAASVVQTQPGQAATTKEGSEEQTEFKVMLVSAGEKKIQVIKEVRAILGLGLKEAKDLVEGAPKLLKENITRKEAEEIKAKIEAVGAQVEIK